MNVIVVNTTRVGQSFLLPQESNPIIDERSQEVEGMEMHRLPDVCADVVAYLRRPIPAPHQWITKDLTCVMASIIYRERWSSYDSKHKYEETVLKAFVRGLLNKALALGYPFAESDPILDGRNISRVSADIIVEAGLERRHSFARKATRVATAAIDSGYVTTEVFEALERRYGDGDGGAHVVADD